MTSATRAGDQRALIVGAAVVGLILLLGRGIPALRSWQADAERLAGASLDEQAHVRELTRAYPALRESLSVRSRDLAELQRSTLRGQSRASAASALANFVTEAGFASGVQIGAVQLNVDSIPTHHLWHVRVVTDGTGDAGSIARMLAKLDAAATPLVVRDVSISGSGAPAAVGQPQMPNILHVALTVDAIALSDSAAMPATSAPVPVASASSPPAVWARSELAPAKGVR